MTRNSYSTFDNFLSVKMCYDKLESQLLLKTLQSKLALISSTSNQIWWKCAYLKLERILRAWKFTALWFNPTFYHVPVFWMNSFFGSFTINMHIINNCFVIDIYNTEWHFEALHEWKMKSCILLFFLSIIHLSNFEDAHHFVSIL